MRFFNEMYFVRTSYTVFLHHIYLHYLTVEILLHNYVTLFRNFWTVQIFGKNIRLPVIDILLANSVSCPFHLGAYLHDIRHFKSCFCIL